MSVNKQKKRRSLAPLPWTAFVPLSDASCSDAPGATLRPVIAADCLQTSVVASQDSADQAASEARWQAFTDEFLKAKEAGAEEEDEIVEVDPVPEEERLAERKRIWEWVVARCLESMPEWDRQQWLREQREQERLEEWQERTHAQLARAKRDESWADWSGSGPASEYIEY
ncbi:hypothetical protein B0H14DRAFT_3543439 [Mycena olivaceomarginata]|nr:hypothetical protein B0H14DRAFT_3543439 [Mycena olivaceomarginata]